jgi:ribosome-associated translation inhibitor RaiA
MQINITSSSKQDLEKVQQIILYYHVQLEEMLQLLRLNLTRMPDNEGKVNFRVVLDAVQLTGQDITMEEVQNDLQAATNRVLNRLLRMTRRGMVAPDRRFNMM